VLVIVATVEDDDHGNVTTSRSVVVANVPPRFEEEPDLFIDYDEYDIPVRAIVFARYADRGSRDEHTVTIVWGDGPTDANIPVGDGAVAFVRDLSSTPFVDLDSLYPTGVTLRDDDNGVIFVNVQRPAVNLPRFKVSKGPHEIDMRAHNNKTTAQVTALVEQALRAKLAEIAQEQLPNVLFVYNEPTLRPQNPNVAYGEAGYVIGWKTDARLGPPLDFSGTLISYFAYYVRYEDAHIGRPLRFTSGNRVETVPTPTSTAGHETWHTDGIPGEEYNNWAQNHDIVVATTKKKMGFWKELSTSRNQVQNALRALQVGTDAAALAALNQILDQHLVGWQAGMRITNAGVWHGGLVTGSDLKQYYEYQGAWEFK
jgi:hypothetical protein